MADNLIIEQHGHVTVLTLNRPEAMNSLDYELYDALENAVRTSDARAIVITGSGTRAFCAGDDVKKILSKGAPVTPERAAKAKETGGLTPAADALLHTDIPVIAAINGFALGWGAELAIMAGLRRTLDPDWRDTGKWAITEIRRLMQTQDAKESAAAFLEKRNPVFTGN